jgi:hypothetical protein
MNEYKSPINWGWESQEGRYSCRTICHTTKEGQRFVTKEIYGDMPPLNLYKEREMNCCNDFGNCDQGRDCPIRKQRANDAYINRGLEPSPYEDVASTFKVLLVLIAVTAAFTLLAFVIWGK